MRIFGKGKKSESRRKSKESNDDEQELDMTIGLSSLGCGALAEDCQTVEDFVPSNPNSPANGAFYSRDDISDAVGALSEIKQSGTESGVVFKRDLSSFLRVTDLKIDDVTPGLAMSTSSSSETCSSIDDEKPSATGSNFANFYRAAVNPPPGVTHDPAEKWIALDNGEGSHAPIAPFAVEALVQSAVVISSEQSKWNPDGKTAKWRDQNKNGWDQCTWIAPSQDALNEGANLWDRFPNPNSPENSRVFVWSTTFGGGGYGSELPAIRVAAIIPASAEQLMQLLVDSNRVHEYNKLSLGRSDVLVLQDALSPDGPFGGITKVMTSESSILRKTMQFTSLMHARELKDGYKIVTRAVESPFASATALKSEILLGVNTIWRVPGDDKRCLLIAINHVRSPMVPMMIAKRIGLQAAVNFINDVRQCCSQYNKP